MSFSEIEKNDVRCPDTKTAERMVELIKETKKQGDSLGGIVQCVIQNPVIGIGEPVFDRLNAQLAKAMFSINAVKGFELGSGFDGVKMKGSEHNDPFILDNGIVKTSSNRSGGIQGIRSM